MAGDDRLRCSDRSDQRRASAVRPAVGAGRPVELSARRGRSGRGCPGRPPRSSRRGACRRPATATLYFQAGTLTILPLRRSRRASSTTSSARSHIHSGVLRHVDAGPLVELGAGVAGAERHHPYAERPRRLADGLAEVGDPRLAGRVRRSRHRRHRSRQPKRHLSLPHCAVRSSAAAPRGSAACTACTLSRSSRASSSAGGAQERLVQADPGVVDQQVDRGAVGEPALDRGAAVVGGQVGGDRLDLAAVPAGQLGGELASAGPRPGRPAPGASRRRRAAGRTPRRCRRWRR